MNLASKILYLVQVRPEFRFLWEDSYINTDGYTHSKVRLGAGLTAFASRQEAEKWASQHAPITFNPLIEAGEFPTEDGEILQQFDDLECTLAQEFEDLIKELGMKPPTALDPGGYRSDVEWFNWWAQAATGMTDEQKTAIWRFAIANPYRIVEVELEP